MSRRVFDSGTQIAVTVVAVVAAIVATVVVTSLLDGDDPPVPTKQEPGAYTRWYAQQALDRYERDGRQATLDYYNGGGGVDGDWYVVIIDTETGRTAAHATLPHRVGEDSASRVDITGFPFGAAVVAAPEEGTWVDFVFLNAATGEPGLKHSWAINRDGLVFLSGWYENSYQRPAPTKDEPGAYTKAFVEDAVWRYVADGPEAVVDYYNTPESVDGEWYVFVMDENGTAIAHPTHPQNVGQSILGPLGTDSTGREFGSEFLEATETGRWVDYVYRNPETGAEEIKHTWIVRYEDLYFGSGWYEQGPG